MIFVGLTALFARPELFTPDGIAAFLAKFQNEALSIYLAVSVIRGFTLLPSTPFVIAGTLAFPASPWIVLAISIVGIIVSSSLIYWFSDVLGISDFFEKKKPAAVAKIRSRLEHPTGLLFVFLWAFFPLVPTDAVCYVAGSTRMNFLKFIAVIAAGEVILCSFYIFSVVLSSTSLDKMIGPFVHRNDPVIVSAPLAKQRAKRKREMIDQVFFFLGSSAATFADASMIWSQNSIDWIRSPRSVLDEDFSSSPWKIGL